MTGHKADARLRVPMAVRLESNRRAGDHASSGRKLPQVLPEADPAPEAEAPPAPVASRRWRWGALFAAALSGFLSLVLWLWLERTVRDLLAQSPLLGLAALALLGLAGLALLIMLGRLLRDLMRARHVEALRREAAEVLTVSDLDRARRVAREVAGLTASSPESARGRARLEELLPDLFAARDILAVTERELLAPLDRRAAALVARSARQVSLVTALSPRALLDIGFVLYACARLLRDVSGVYGARPGFIGLMRLARGVLGHLVITGGMAAGDTLIQQIMGHGIAARLSAKMGEGVLNGLLTARVGLSAIALCRPLAFVEEPMPKMADVAGELLSRKDD